MSIDIKALAGTVKDVVLDGLNGLVDGAEEDLRAFGQAIAEDLVRVAATGNPALVAEVVAQARALGEVQRIRANAAGWAAATKIIKAVGGTLLGAIGGLL